MVAVTAFNKLAQWIVRLILDLQFVYRQLVESLVSYKLHVWAFFSDEKQLLYDTACRFVILPPYNQTQPIV